MLFRSTALRDQQVGETYYQRVGGNTGQSVTAAALHTDDQLAYADGSLSNLEA